jgi:hypothetical protein
VHESNENINVPFSVELQNYSTGVSGVFNVIHPIWYLSYQMVYQSISVVSDYTFMSGYQIKRHICVGLTTGEFTQKNLRILTAMFFQFSQSTST